MNMYLSELQDKDIISMKTGLNYGHVIDVEIGDNGQIISFVVENRKIFQRSFKKEEITFKYSDIEKIGKDVVLVRV